MKNLLIIAAGVLAAGCVDTSKDSGGTTVDPVADPSFAVSWGANGIDLAITDGEGSYYFGMAETGDTCSANPENCWTGEDCIYGYDTYLYCHPTSDTGVSLTYGGAFDALTEGSETVFPGQTNDAGDAFDGSVTYYIEYADGSCASWGHDTSYYASLGCDAL